VPGDSHSEETRWQQPSVNEASRRGPAHGSPHLTV